MADNKKKLSPKLKPRPKAKPTATDELIRDMADRYRLAYVGETPDDIYRRRKEVHEEMSKYSNELEIYDALRLYEKKYGVESEPLYGMVLTSFKDIFPGYLADTDSEGNVIGYSRIDNYDVVPEGSTPVIGDMDIDTFSKIRNEVHVPDFLNTYVWYQTPSTQPSTNSQVEEYKDEDLAEQINSDDNLSEDMHLAYFYEPSALYVIPRVTGEFKVNVPLPVSNGIRTVNEIIELPINTTLVNSEVSDSLVEPLNEQPLETLNNEYFPTTLNRSVYAPKVDLPLDLEPELNDEEYSRLYENKAPSMSEVREKVRLPEEIFANMTDLNKVMYDMLDMQRRRSYGRLTPQATALLNYTYELLYPTYLMPHPLTYELWMMHPVSYPNIPLLRFFFDPKTRKYVYVKN